MVYLYFIFTTRLFLMQINIPQYTRIYDELKLKKTTAVKIPDKVKSHLFYLNCIWLKK